MTSVTFARGGWSEVPLGNMNLGGEGRYGERVKATFVGEERILEDPLTFAEPLAPTLDHPRELRVVLSTEAPEDRRVEFAPDHFVGFVPEALD
jgi:hypothetical protein